MAEFEAKLQLENEFINQLLTDFDSILRDELRDKGYSPKVIPDKDALAIAYISTFNRRIVSRTRTVHINPDISVPEEMREGFDNLISKLRNGNNVNPHLSRLTAKIESIDLLFYDWGINHLHLGKNIEADGFVNRTGPVAFVITKPNDVYVVSVAAHGNWSDMRMLEIIDRNWPELIEKYRIDGEFEYVPNSSELNELRKAHVNVGITLPNKHSYTSIGGGFMTSGVSANAVQCYLSLKHQLKNLYKSLCGNVYINSDDQNINCTANFRFKRKDKQILLYIEGYNWESKFLDFIPLPQ